MLARLHLRTEACVVFEPARILQTNLDLKALGRAAHRNATRLGFPDLSPIAFALRVQTVHETHESRVECRLDGGAKARADARRDTAARNRDAHGTSLGDRLHRDEAVTRLIDRTEEKAMTIRHAPQSDRKRFVLRRADHEKSVPHDFFRSGARVLDPLDRGADLRQRFGLLTGFAIVAAHAATPPAHR